MQPQHDEAGLTSNFFPDSSTRARPCACIVPAVIGRASASPIDPVTGADAAAVNIGRIVPNSGNLTNGIGQAAMPASRIA